MNKKNKARKSYSEDGKKASRKMKKASKVNPWLNFLKDFREKNKMESNVQLMRDAGAIFKSLTIEEKDKFRVDGYKSPTVEKKTSQTNNVVESSSDNSTDTKKGRGKKQQA